MKEDKEEGKLKLLWGKVSIPSEIELLKDIVEKGNGIILKRGSSIPAGI